MQHASSSKHSDPLQTEPPQISDIIEQLGLGRGQIIVFLVACGVFLVEGLELVLLSLMATTRVGDFYDQPHYDGILLSVVFAGALVGNVLSGLCADRVGRQFLIIIAYACVILFSTISSFMNGWFSVTFLRFFVGLGFGIGQPAAIALIKEVTPPSLAFVATACSWLFFCLGALLALLLIMCDDPWLQGLNNVGWRLLLRCAVIPVILFGILAIFLLPESPFFLAAIQEYASARDMLDTLRKQNDQPYVNVIFTANQTNQQVSTLGQIFDPSMLVSTYTLASCYLALNFALYGMAYALPKVLLTVLAPHTGDLLPPSIVLLLGLVAALATVIFSTIWALPVERRHGLTFWLVFTAFAALNFYWVDSLQQRGQIVILTFSCFGLCVGPAFGLFLCDEILSATFPALTNVASATVRLSVSRVGVIVAPLVFDKMQETSPEWRLFFMISALLEVFCVVLLNAPLRPLFDDDWPLEPACESIQKI